MKHRFTYSPRLVITTVLLSLLPLFALSQGHIYPSKQQSDSLKKEIDSMLDNENSYWAMIRYGEMDKKKITALRQLESSQLEQRLKDVEQNIVGISQAQKDSLAVLQRVVYADNFARLSAIITQYGFHHKYISEWQIAQILMHNPSRMLTDKFLETLLKEVEDERMESMDYAVGYDEVQRYRGLPELYCFDDYDFFRRPIPHTPKDIVATNAARRKIGIKKWSLPKHGPIKDQEYYLAGSPANRRWQVLQFPF